MVRKAIKTKQPSFPLKPSNSDAPALEINTADLKRAAMIYRAINHKLRVDILKTIHVKKEMTVTELFVKLRIEQSVASQQLGILRRAGLVNARRDKKNIYYAVNFGRIQQLHDIVLMLLVQ